MNVIKIQLFVSILSEAMNAFVRMVFMSLQVRLVLIWTNVLWDCMTVTHSRRASTLSARIHAVAIKAFMEMEKIALVIFVEILI